MGILGPLFRSPYDRDGKSTSFPRSNSIDWMNWKEIRSDKADLERSLGQANHERSLQKALLADPGISLYFGSRRRTISSLKSRMDPRDRKLSKRHLPKHPL